MPDALDKSSSNVASQKDKFEERFKSYCQLPCCIKFSSYTFLSFKKAPLNKEGLSSCLNFLNWSKSTTLNLSISRGLISLVPCGIHHEI